MTAPTTGERECVCHTCGASTGPIVHKGDLPAMYHRSWTDCIDALRADLAHVTAQLATAQREAAGLREL